MPHIHKYNTISFRASEYEHKEIDIRVAASGMAKQDYIVRSCIYNRICVVGKKENIQPLVDELKSMHKELQEISASMVPNNDWQNEFLALIKVATEIIDGAGYLFK